YQQTDTYYIVAHFHYVLFGGAIFGLFAGIYYWWPKVFGGMLSETGGKLNFWLRLIGFNLTFGPMHILGLQGMPRRIQSYPASLGLAFWNMVATIGAFVIAISVLVFLVNAIASFRKPKQMEADPWDARTLEWATSSPPPEYNFEEIPVVHSLDDLWHRKYAETEGGRVVPVAAGGSGEAAAIDGHAGEHGAEGGGGHAIHMPSPSYFPLIAAAGLPVAGYGLIFGVPALALGLVITLAGFFGGALEPSAEGPVDGQPRALGRTSGRRSRRHQHGAAEPQARDVAVPGLGLPAVRRADLDVRALPGRKHHRALPRRRVRHPVHVGVILRTARELAHDGARAVGDPAGRRGPVQGLAARDGAARDDV